VERGREGGGEGGREERLDVGPETTKYTSSVEVSGSLPSLRVWGAEDGVLVISMTLGRSQKAYTSSILEGA